VADLRELLLGIQGGDYDGHEAEIVDAVRKRVTAGLVKFAWRISYQELDITEENLTVGEAKVIEDILGSSIYAVPPAGSAENIAAYLVACLVNRSGLSRDVATKQVDGESIKALLGCVTDYTLVDPPKESGDQT
jgi:hypothetical protein